MDKYESRVFGQKEFFCQIDTFFLLIVTSAMAEPFIDNRLDFRASAGMTELIKVFKKIK
jgi:hypothetical protein